MVGIINTAVAAEAAGGTIGGLAPLVWWPAGLIAWVVVVAVVAGLAYEFFENVCLTATAKLSAGEGITLE